MSLDDTAQLVHELETHQIELQMQNEELRNAQEELIEVRDQYTDLYDFAPIGYLTTNGKGTIIQTNLTFTEMLGYPRSHMVGKLLSAFIGAESQDLYYTCRSRVLESSNSEGCELRLLSTDGRVLWVRLDGVCVKGASSDKKDQIRWVLCDITENKKAEVENEKLKYELEQKSKMEALGQLAGGIAHNFNNLLQVVLGNLEMVQDSKFSADKKSEMIEKATAAIEHAGVLTQQLLSYSQKQALNPGVIDINRSLSDISLLLQGALGKSITLETKYANNPVPVNIDPGSFESAILNLAFNARFAMPMGGTMTIETATLALKKAISREDGDLPVSQYAVVTVSDTGCGMSEEVLNRAIEPFFTTREVGQGTGLGLSTVYGFSRQSGGHTTIDSEPGKGTTVRMYLPIAVAETVVEPDQLDNMQAETSGRGTVLVVEDEPGVLDVTVSFLKRIGYEVLSAGSGPSALVVLQQHDDIDLVLSDVIMPEGMTGIDLAEEIHRHHRDVKVLLMSGYPTGGIDQDGTLQDRFVLLRKPYTKDQLAAAVKAAIDD